MKYSNFLILLLIGGFVLVSSCRKDDEDIPTDDEPIDDVIQMTDQTAQLITEWSNQWVLIDQFTSGQRPNSVTRSLAYIHLTGYETAVPFMSDYSSNTDRLDEFNINLDNLDSNVDLNLALNEAYAKAIDHFMFDFQTFTLVRKDVRDFRNKKTEELSEGLSEDVIQNSKSWGRYIA